jgi:penicillin amidase
MVFYFLFKASLPEREGEIQIAGINSSISIYFDAMGIPQIWADNEEDAWFAVGWLHASDRLFQMDLTRRVATGRLSEVFGDLTLSFDRKQRLIGHQIIAQKDMSNLNEFSRRLLMSYSKGINQWVNHTPVLPFEFQLLNTEFEPWSVTDCLAIFSFQTWFIDELQNNDGLFLSIEKKTDKKTAEDLIPLYPKEAPKTVPQFKHNDNNHTDSQPKYASESDLKEFMYQSLFSGTGTPFLMTRSSNAWAVSGGKSRSGDAIICSDPHLELSRLPQFWYMVGVHTKDKSLETLGITSPGIPLIAMGHNGQIAWAFTAGGTDVTDEYIELLNPENPDEYRIGNEYTHLTKRLELITVDGRDKVDSLEVKTSRHGPVVQESDSSNQVITLRWAGFDFSPSEGFQAGFHLLKCNNFLEFRKSVTHFGALNANWIYADQNGNIGYQLGSPIPIRNKGTGRSRLPGWDRLYDWSGYYDLDKTPYAYNPSRGWLANCNNKPDEDNLEYSLFGNFADDRIRRIRELLSGFGKLSLANMKIFQNDLKSTGLVRWKDEAIKILNDIDRPEWAERLANWSENGSLTSRETALLEIWLVLLKKATFQDDFGDLTHNLLNKVLYRERNFYKLYTNYGTDWFDDKRTEGRIETRDELTQKAMKDAIDIVGERSWGDVQTLTISHPLAIVPILSSFLSLERGPFPRAGTSGSLNNSISFWDEKDSFQSVAGPSWRFIMDFDDIDMAQMVMPAGQSGHPLSPHFFDFYDLWEKGEYWTVPFSREKVKERSVSILSLVPNATD